MEQEKDLRSLKIGTKTADKLEAAKCRVIEVRTEYIEKAKLNKAIFLLKHPKKDEPLKLSSATILRIKKDKKEIVTSATWVSTISEEDGQLALDKNSTLSAVLKHYGCADLNAIVGQDVDTESDTEGYLTIKAY